MTNLECRISFPEVRSITTVGRHGAVIVEQDAVFVLLSFLVDGIRRWREVRIESSSRLLNFLGSLKRAT